MSQEKTSKICPKCGAKWIGGQLYWSTGVKASEGDLAGLVCNNYGDETCINKEKGALNPEADTWEKRLSFLKSVRDE